MKKLLKELQKVGWGKKDRYKEIVPISMVHLIEELR
jgi:hypothetical protein